MTYDPYETPRRPPPGPSRLLVGLVMILGLLLGFSVYRFIFGRGAVAVEPRVVTPRGDLAEEEKSTIDLFRAASPSVVFITTVRRTGIGSRNIYEMQQGTGSGFIWDSAGDIVTNFHVVQSIAQGQGYATVTLANHDSRRATVVGVAPNYDLAVLRISGVTADLRPIPIGESSNLLVGQKCFAIGNPFGLDQTLTTGVVSALGRSLPAVTGRTIEDVIQTDASINPGNSGGPLLDSAGRLIGVNTAIFSPSGTSAGIGFAVPVDTVNRIIPQLLSRGQVTRPYLGIRPIDNYSREIIFRLRQRGFEVEGLLATQVDADSPAGRAGIKGITPTPDGFDPGDIIVQVDGKDVKTADQLYAILERHQPGDTITLTIWRRGKLHEVEVQLEPPKD